MNPLANEIQQALNDVQQKLNSNQTLDDKAMLTLFLTSLIEEANRGEQ